MLTTRVFRTNFKIQQNRICASLNHFLSVTSGCRRDVDKNRALLGHYAASSCNFLTSFRDNPSGPVFKGSRIFLYSYFRPLKMGPDGFSRNFDKKLPLNLTFMEPCIARCVFYVTNEMQLIQCSLLL